MSLGGIHIAHWIPYGGNINTPNGFSIRYQDPKRT